MRINAAAGWWDAGDYLKFVQTTSYTVDLLLAGVRDFPNQMGAGSAGVELHGRGQVRRLLQPVGLGYHINGCTTAVENGQSWVVSYAIRLDETWTTRNPRITGQSALGTRHAS